MSPIISPETRKYSSPYETADRVQNMIVIVLKEGKQKVRDRILEQDKQIKEVALQFPERAAKTSG